MTSVKLARCLQRLCAGLAFVLGAGVVGDGHASHGSATHATASGWDRSDVTEVRLIAAQSAVDMSGTARLGLHFRLAPQWKIYWRTPGDSGLPPEIDWSGSRNLASTEIAWPAPARFYEVGDLVTHGYKDEVVLPITARAAEPGKPLELRALVDYVACKEICIPFQAEVALDLPRGPAAPTPYAGLIQRFDGRVPGPPGSDGPRIEAIEVAGSGANRILRVVARAETPFTSPRLFVESEQALALSPPEVELSGGAKRAVFRAAAPAKGEDGTLIGTPLTLTLVDGDRAVEQTLTAAAGAGEPPWLGALAAMLGLAFVGGLILNLMPCVLPVLSLKVMGVVGLGGAARRRVVAGFTAAAGGIVASFLALGVFAMGLKAGGRAVGWGIQFQEPLFLVALVVVLTVFAANLWGLFEVRLPAWLGGLGGAPERRGLAGHFASGAFATLLATPCSAPFLGTAVGFALARGPAEIVSIFTALGLGMATPYLAVAAFPGVAARLPRPGPWMVKLRRLLGILLGGTALWLLTVLAAQSGAWAAVVVGGLMAAVIGVLWVAARAQWRRLVPGGALAILLALAFVAPGQLEGAAPTAGQSRDASLWQPFDRTQIPQLVAAGKTVFVDVTAEWCVTCQFNKATVLTRGEVAERLGSDRVVAMRADWTSPDPEIAAYLEDFGRYGIPFNAVYGPALPRGMALPELLTRDAVLTAMDRAGSAVASTD